MKHNVEMELLKKYLKEEELSGDEINNLKWFLAKIEHDLSENDHDHSDEY